MNREYYVQKVTQILSVGLIAVLVFFTGYFIGNGTGKQDYRSAIAKADRMEKLSAQLGNTVEELRDIERQNDDYIESLERHNIQAGKQLEDAHVYVTEIRARNSVLEELIRESGIEAGELTDALSGTANDIERFIQAATVNEK